MANKKTMVAVARTPLAGCTAPKRAGLQLEELPACGKLILRGKGDDPAFCKTVEATLHTPLPHAPNTTTTAGKDGLLLWLGPEEWLLWTPLEKLQRTHNALHKALAAQHAAVVEVSDYYTLLRIGGKQARQVLAHGCPLDLREAHFGSGACAQSHFRNAPILLHNRGKDYAVQVRWSFAPYLWAYFNEVGDLLAD